MAAIVAGHQTLTVSTTAVSLTVPTPAARAVEFAAIYVEGAVIRWRADGTAPTTSTGAPAYPSPQPLLVYGVGQLANFKAIRKDGTDAVLQIVYYREGP